MLIYFLLPDRQHTEKIWAIQRLREEPNWNHTAKSEWEYIPAKVTIIWEDVLQDSPLEGEARFVVEVEPRDKTSDFDGPLSRREAKDLSMEVEDLDVHDELHTAFWKFTLGLDSGFDDDPGLTATDRAGDEDANHAERVGRHGWWRGVGGGGGGDAVISAKMV
ncbi:hypothetical protein AC579_3287 [Pseudocercospora musae]|uniref:Uncharacterized protein n=1 Tax=Pseudocercospora musae TaxID=113226 RepID=A0A139IDL0_9PEZI|nr:hypothetical protein AC579_3287 [Pseudocercospora musae]